MKDGNPLVALHRNIYAKGTIAKYSNGTEKIAHGVPVDVPYDELTHKLDYNDLQLEYKDGKVLETPTLIALSDEEKKAALSFDFSAFSLLPERNARNIAMLYDYMKQFEDPAKPNTILPKLETD